MFVVMLSLSTTAVALRFYTRSRLLNILGTDDWLILGAWVSPSSNSRISIEVERHALFLTQFTVLFRRRYDWLHPP